MLTPSHVHGLTYTFQVMNLGSVLMFVGEWQPPNFQDFSGFEVWLLALVATALAGRLRLPLVRLLVIVGLVHMSLQHGRYMAVTGVVAPFFLAAPFAAHWYSAQNWVAMQDHSIACLLHFPAPRAARRLALREHLQQSFSAPRSPRPPINRRHEPRRPPL